MHIYGKHHNSLAVIRARWSVVSPPLSIYFHLQAFDCLFIFRLCHIPRSQNVIATHDNKCQNYKYNIQVVNISVDISVMQICPGINMQSSTAVYLTGRLLSLLLLSPLLFRMLRADRAKELLVLSHLPVGSIRVD